MAHQDDPDGDSAELFPPELAKLLDDMRNSPLFKKPRPRYERPDRGIAGLISRTLPPLPADTPIYQPTKQALGQLRSYRLPALGLMIVAIATLITMVYTVPWMRTSPATLIYDYTTTVFDDFWGPILGGVVTFGLLMLVSTAGGTSVSRYRSGFWDSAAMLEEQWFRTGAEHWTTGQRLYSTIMFGFVHILNIIYPIASLVVVTLVGGVFMAVYLANYRRTGSSEVATLSSAKLHASYNRFAILYFVVAVGITLIVSLVY